LTPLDFENVALQLVERDVEGVFGAVSLAGPPTCPSLVRADLTLDQGCRRFLLVGVEPDVRVDDVHIRVLARDLLDGFDDVLTRGRVQQGDVGDLYVHRVLLGERERAQHVGFRHHARDGVSSLRRDHQPGDVVVEHAFDDGLHGLVGGRGDDGARHDVVNGDIEHPVDVASAVAAALSLLIANDELDDVVGGDDADGWPSSSRGGEPEIPFSRSG